MGKYSETFCCNCERLRLFRLKKIVDRIIAVNYEARNNGVNRGMRGDEAMKKCPDIKLVSVPEVRGKADLTR